MASQNIKYDFKSDALNSAPIIEPPVYSDVVIDEVFGEITHDGLNYRGVSGSFPPQSFSFLDITFFFLSIIFSRSGNLILLDLTLQLGWASAAVLMAKARA